MICVLQEWNYIPFFSYSIVFIISYSIVSNTSTNELSIDPFIFKAQTFKAFKPLPLSIL